MIHEVPKYKALFLNSYIQVYHSLQWHIYFYRASITEAVHTSSLLHVLDEAMWKRCEIPNKCLGHPTFLLVPYNAYFTYPNSWSKLEGGTLLLLALAGAHFGRTLPEATGFWTLHCSSSNSNTSTPSRSASIQRAP